MGALMGFRDGKHCQAEDGATGDGEVSAALVGVFSEMSGKCEGLSVFGYDPSYRAAMGGSGIKFIEAHPSFSTTGVNPFNQSQRTVSHACAQPLCVPLTSDAPEELMPLRCVPPCCGSCASIVTPYDLLASMYVRMP